jgi:ABC-type multidrug transport system ATPase subunit
MCVSALPWPWKWTRTFCSSTRSWPSGDAAFQMKCLDRIRQFQKKGKTLFLVSHALETVGEFCDEVMLIHDGQLLDQGDPSTVILSYLKSYMVRIGMLNVEEHGTRDVEIEEAVLE